MDPSDYAARAEDLIRADCRMISGCEDAQTSADVSNVSKFSLPDPAGRAGGACTSALLNVLYQQQQQQNAKISFVDVLRQMRGDLQKGKFTQNPQLSSSRNIDLSLPFHVVNPNSNSGSGSGTKRSLLIGINYVGQQGQLSGCHNDALNIQKYLIEEQGFSEQHMTVLLDDGNHQNPTRKNIIAALQALAEEAQPGDSVFFHYSGHGGSLPDDNGDEEDGRDETMIPVDFQQAGQIRDDELFEKFIVPLQQDVTVTCLMDCCHSGSILDLPYMFTADGKQDTAPHPQMQANAQFDFAKVGKVAMKVLPAAWRAYQRASRAKDPFSACMAFCMAMMPVFRAVSSELGKVKK